MIKNHSSLLLLLVSMFMLSSCLSDTSDEIVYYDDTAVTAFSLGTLNITYHTTASDGVTDSTYTSTLDCSGYHFNIDQVGQTIYNPDSLPVGVDAAHVIATISAKNSGTVVLNLHAKDGSDSLAYYNSSDSIDFTNPVRVRVYNMMGTAYRQYTVHVNVHQQSGDEFAWQSTEAGLTAMGARRFVEAGSTMYLFGQSNGATVGFRKSGNGWTALTLATTLDADAYKNMIVKGSTLYTLSNGSLLSSTDGETWNTVTAATGLTQLLGATAKRMYALTATGISQSTDDGATWTADAIDDEAANLPATDVNFVVQSSRTNDDTYNLTLLGNRDGKTVVWSKVEEDADNSDAQPWSFYPADEYNRKTLPSLANLQVVLYGDELVAMGGDFTKVYTSPDQGLTWDTNTIYVLPEAFGYAAAPFALGTDSSHHLYISKSGSGLVWSAQLARLAWADDQQVFTK